MAGYRRLGRTSDQRKALLRDLVTDLIINGRIETTEIKAKELRKLADKMVTLAKRNTLATRRQAAEIIRYQRLLVIIIIYSIFVENNFYYLKISDKLPFFFLLQSRRT